MTQLLSLLLTTLMAPAPAAAGDTVATDTVWSNTDISEAVVTTRAVGLRRLRTTAQNTQVITTTELRRAACCNLGESFTTNPSVDVSYSDAATGAKQIKLLGLSGTYVQMLTENAPNFRGAAAPYGLGYLAGPWIQSIQVSKGAGSVKQGYESVTGQINVEMLKPQAEPSLALNAYADHRGRVEGNVTGNAHLGERWSSGLLLHGEKAFAGHDDNGDGFIDAPKVRQVAVMNRWAYMGERYIFQGLVKMTDEQRESGEETHHASTDHERYAIDLTTHRWETTLKNAYIFDAEHNGNVALLVTGSLHDQDATYGHKVYNVLQKHGYASLMLERDGGEEHSFSVGLSYTYDDYRQQVRFTADPQQPLLPLNEREGVGGGYAQYTFHYDNRLLLMAGLRYDYSSVYGGAFTPRLHLRWNLSDALTLQASAGRGYRSPHRLAESSYLLASSRTLVVDERRLREEAWNIGGGVTASLTLFDRPLTFGAEYYFTRFHHQAVVDLDTDPHAALLTYNVGASQAHAAQAELTYQAFKDFTLTAAYRYTDVRENYVSGAVQRPLTSHSKGLVTMGYAPMMGKWQLDVTLALNGGGRLPTPAADASGQAAWRATYHAYSQLSAQVTRSFRHWDLYVGGENLTGYRQAQPIIDAAHPWGENFDATMVYAPLHGALGYVGVRYHLTKY